ncbi:MAG: 23S rRNA (uracil(1939)-C(5))-methyltransferase RlmD [Clostridiales bacterium]|nr:23S rRNA (uracil(1939)-C(5))-methyltransferase RlmD [Clostridiales bacterium]
MKICPYAKKCGGCTYQGVPYEEQLIRKQAYTEKLLGEFCQVHPIIGMEQPYHYRNKVHAVFSRNRDGSIVSGIYEENSHRVVPVDACQIENEEADAIIRTIRGLLRSFKITVYDEKSGIGLLRHVLIRTASKTDQILVALVVTSPVFPSKKNFAQALLKAHPRIKTIVLNINTQRTSMVLGKRDIIIYGPGYIEDQICGCTFRISAQSFYQINPPQAEKLYQKAIELAGLTGKERLIDAYCGTGTIGLSAAKAAGEVIGIELNKEAVKDAIQNARVNQIRNARFFCADASDFMEQMASEGERADVVIMDPPRSGSTEVFLRAAAHVSPQKIVYISCNPETQRRDLLILKDLGYIAQEAWAYDFFPWTEHVESIVKLTRSGS